MSGNELDPAAIMAALGVTDATATGRVSGGWDTVIWRVERGGGDGSERRSGGCGRVGHVEVAHHRGTRQEGT